MNSNALLVSLLLLVPHTLGAWAPCGAIPSTHCQSSEFATLPAGNSSGEIGLPMGSGTGNWRVEQGSLIEDSRTHVSNASDFDAACVRELGVFRSIDPPFPLSDLFEARVKVRITADGGGLAGFLFSNAPMGSYFRWQLNSQPACNESSLVFRSADVDGNPTALSNTGATLSVAARRNEWYELRILVDAVDAVHGGFHLNSIEQNPTTVPAVTGNTLIGTAPLIVGGTFIALWCSARGTTGGCEFRDYVIVSKSLRDKLVGPLDCNACNLQFGIGDRNWCRCCDQQCAPFTLASCVSNNFCASECLSAKSCNGTTGATQITTATPAPSATPAPPGATTTAPGGSTTAAPGDSTATAAPGDSTAAPGDSTTTVASGDSTAASDATTGDGSSTSGGSSTSTTMSSLADTSSAAVLGIATAALLIGPTINI